MVDFAALGFLLDFTRQHCRDPLLVWARGHNTVDAECEFIQNSIPRIISACLPGTRQPARPGSRPAAG